MDKAKISDAELEILKIIWEQKKATVGQVHKKILAQRNDSITRNTVQVQIKRLVAKGRLQRQKIDGKYFYFATENEEESRHEIAVDIKQRVFGGSVSKLVKCLFNNDDISDKDLEELEEFLKKNKGDKK